MSTGSSSWITKKRRLAIYLRDNLTCVYCLKSITDGVSLSLDHVIARHKGGTHKSENVITCCISCNSSKQDKELPEDKKALVEYLTGKNMKPYLKIAGEMLKDNAYGQVMAKYQGI